MMGKHGNQNVSDILPNAIFIHTTLVISPDPYNENSDSKFKIINIKLVMQTLNQLFYLIIKDTDDFNALGTSEIYMKLHSMLLYS
jgi:hypothetical protein